MLYVKAAVVGIVWAALFALMSLVAPMAVVWLMLLAKSIEGSGGLGAVSVSSGWALAAALIGFTIGFYRTIRRARRQRF
jgi:hypothetical protein